MRKRIIYTILMLCTLSSANAVTQPGEVRTIARQGRPGTPIEGAVVRVRGSHNAILSRQDGQFAIVLQSLNNGDPYAISSVVKSGYEPAEQELIGRRLPCSDRVPLEILLVRTADLQAEKEAIANKARANVEIYYEKRLKELNRQLAAKRLSEQEYARKLEELEGQYERFEPLLQTMSDKLARIDYSRMDSLTARIQSAIEQGNPEEAERLVREKGNIEEREVAIREQEERVRRAQEVIDQAQTRVDEQRASIARSKRELADDYYRMYSAFLSRFQNDSADFYIRRRAELDTTNVDYQLQAGQFVKDIMADYETAQRYFERAYRIAEKQYGEQSGQMATTCHELGSICKLRGNTDASLEWYNRSLAIREKLRGKESAATAETLNNLGELYRAQKDLKQAMDYHQRALRIREKQFGSNSLEVAESKNNIAGVYFQRGQINMAKQLFLEVHEVYATNPKVQQSRVASNYNNLGSVCYKQGKYTEAADYFEKAVTTYRKVLGDNHPLTRNAMNNSALCKQKTRNQKQ